MEKLKRMQTRSSTAKTYYSVWKQFNKFLIRLDMMPESWEDRTSLFVTHLIEFKQFQSASVKSYISAIKRTLLDDGYDWSDNCILLNSLTRACRIVNDRITTRLPIRCSLLELILFELERMFIGQPYLETLYKAMFAIGYYGLLRIGEMTESPHVMRARNVFIGVNKEKILIVLYSSKTHDQKMYPQKIKITSNRSERSGKYYHRHFCPFKLMGSYFAAREQTYADMDEQFFVFSDGSSVTAPQARTVLKSAIARLGFNVNQFNTHSLRIGRSSDLIQYGYKIEEVKIMGWWRSSCIFKYIRN